MTSNNIFRISKSRLLSGVEIALPASKSVANRSILVNALSRKRAKLENMSNARDTALMLSLLDSEEGTLDARDAGTTMRFLTAYLAVTGKNKVLTGTERMKQRPIRILVDALQKLGAEITYLEQAGYPPLKFNGIQHSGINRIQVKADISSQYISALMMIAPCLKDGLLIELEGKIGSRPYIEMTAAVMRSFGGKVTFTGNLLTISGGGYEGTDRYLIEPDWSAASYWYSTIALQKKGSITLKGLTEQSIQGDHVIAQIMENFGVNTKFTEEGAVLTHSGGASRSFSQDFTDCPDLAQTVAVTAAGCGVEVRMTGLESLRIKETDRIKALQNELSKFNCQFVEDGDEWVVLPGKIVSDKEITVETYEDHRMAMAFLPMCAMVPVAIIDPGASAKSYPHFWDDVSNAFSPDQEGK